MISLRSHRTLFFAAATLATLALPMEASAYQLDDWTAVARYRNSAPNNGWTDRIGSSEFEVFGVNAGRSGADIHISLFTNFGLGTGSYSTRTADIAFDLDPTDGWGDYTHGLVLFDHGTSARGDDNSLGVGLYADARWKTSHDVFGPSGLRYAGRYKDCLASPNGSPSGCGPSTDGADIVTYLVGGTLLAAIDVDVTAVSKADGPLGADAGDDPQYRIDVTLGNAAALFGKDWELLWGNATCGNDTIHGSVHVPEPATLCPLLIGLAGLGFSRRRKAA